MSVNRYISRIGGNLTDTVPATTSAGVSSAGQLVALGSNGLLDPSMLPASGGGSSPVGLTTPTPTISINTTNSGSTCTGSFVAPSGPYSGNILLANFANNSIGVIFTVTTNWTVMPNVVQIQGQNTSSASGGYALDFYVRQADITSTGFSVYASVATYAHVAPWSFTYIAL